MLKIKDERIKEPVTEVKVGQIREGQLGMVLVTREIYDSKICVTDLKNFHTYDEKEELIIKQYPNVLNAEIKIYE